MITFEDDPRGVSDYWVSRQMVIRRNGVAVGTATQSYGVWFVRLYDGRTGEGSTKEEALHSAREN